LEDKLQRRFPLAPPLDSNLILASPGQQTTRKPRLEQQLAVCGQELALRRGAQGRSGIREGRKRWLPRA
jgi:hypothetical protein